MRKWIKELFGTEKDTPIIDGPEEYGTVDWPNWRDVLLSSSIIPFDYTRASIYVFGEHFNKISGCPVPGNSVARTVPVDERANISLKGNCKYCGRIKERDVTECKSCGAPYA